MAFGNRHGRGRRKERVLHTRVPRQLEAELKRFAESNRLPVSLVVRAVLEEALESAAPSSRPPRGGTVEPVEPLPWMSRLQRYGEEGGGRGAPDAGPESGGTEVAERRSGGGRGRGTRDRLLRHVIGFQPLTLARPMRCASCGRELASGAEAYVAVRDRRGPDLVVGPECLPGRDAAHSEEEKRS